MRVAMPGAGLCGAFLLFVEKGVRERREAEMDFDEVVDGC